MKAGIIGSGSIAKRHSNILKNMGVTVNCFSRDPNSSLYGHFDNIYGIDEMQNFHNDFWVVCNPTSLHTDTCLKLISYGAKKVFCEKPGPNIKIKNVKILYNLRYTEFIKETYERCKNKKIFLELDHIVNAKNWFKDDAWQKSYVYNRTLGGGAVLTNSHELDLYHLFTKKKLDVSTVVNSNFIKDIDGNFIDARVNLMNIYCEINLSILATQQLRKWKISDDSMNIIGEKLWYKNNNYSKKDIDMINKSYFSMWDDIINKNASFVPDSNETFWITELAEDIYSKCQ